LRKLCVEGLAERILQLRQAVGLRFLLHGKAVVQGLLQRRELLGKRIHLAAL